MTDKLKDKILEAIENEHIAPKAKWNFVLKDYTIWALAIFSLLIGALAFSLTLQSILSADWEIYDAIENDFIKFLLLSLPYFWIVFLGLFIGSAYYNFTQTKTGYKHKLGTTVLASVAVSLLTGTALYAFGISEQTEEIFNQNEMYRHHVNVEHKLWKKPDEGRLIGRVVNVQQPVTVFLQDPDKNLWRIDISSSTPQDFLIIKEGDKLKVIGEKESEDSFIAEKLLPAKPKAPIPLFHRKMQVRVSPETRQEIERMKEAHRIHMESDELPTTASSSQQMILPNHPKLQQSFLLQLPRVPESERNFHLVRTT
ncbi:hypothetical protein H6758_01065 [Candidatus Nomurabacteria bacterium]|nr:hypothetical protein [Candidatus Nomurabacteria bacterium]